MFLLDTTIVSELRKAGDGKANANVTSWVSSVDASSLYLSAMTLMEMELSILRIERRDAAQGVLLRAWMIHHILPEFLSGRWPSMPGWHFAVRPCMYRTRVLSGMP